jgi:hypothetical protein
LETSNNTTQRRKDRNQPLFKHNNNSAALELNHNKTAHLLKIVPTAQTIMYNRFGAIFNTTAKKSPGHCRKQCPSHGTWKHHQWQSAAHLARHLDTPQHNDNQYLHA